MHKSATGGKEKIMIIKTMIITSNIFRKIKFLQFETKKVSMYRVSWSNYSISVFSTFLDYSRFGFFLSNNRIFRFFRFLQIFG